LQVDEICRYGGDDIFKNDAFSLTMACQVV
jgi:hypothetical protein